MSTVRPCRLLGVSSRPRENPRETRIWRPRKCRSSHLSASASPSRANCELDVIVEDDAFARDMEAMYIADLTNATEVILDERPARLHNLRAAGGGGSAGRAAAGLLRVSNTIGAAITNRRKIESVETRIMVAVAIVLVIVGSLVAVFPRLVACPIAAVATWIAGALLYRSYRLHREAKRDQSGEPGSEPVSHRRIGQRDAMWCWGSPPVRGTPGCEVLRGVSDKSR